MQIQPKAYALAIASAGIGFAMDVGFDSNAGRLILLVAAVYLLTAYLFHGPK